MLYNGLNYLFIELPNVHPMVVAVWCGTSKPTDLNLYLGRFVCELNHILAHPIQIDGHQITVKIRCFICDTPARAFIKGAYQVANIIEQ